MECKLFEAKRAIDIAERKISENDFVGAKKFVNKAQNLYPELDGLKQMSMMIKVYISASNKINGEGEADWYGILGVDPLANDEAVKKQYKKLALLIHPDKNKFNGAGEAFKLVSEAWCLLSDKAKRIAYDQKRKAKLFKHSNSGMQQKPTKRHEPEASWEDEIEGRFWTKCNRCNTYCQFGRYSSYLDKTLPCPNCGQDFLVTTDSSKSRCDTSSSTPESDSAKAAYERRMKSWFEPEPEPQHEHEHERDSSSKKQKV